MKHAERGELGQDHSFVTPPQIENKYLGAPDQMSANNKSRRRTCIIQARAPSPISWIRVSCSRLSLEVRGQSQTPDCNKLCPLASILA